MQHVSTYFHRLKRFLKTPFYFKKQTYTVRYQITVKNVSPKSNDLMIIAPVPSDRENQTILSQPRFQPEAERVSREATYGNQFALWEAKLAPGESRLFAETFHVTVLPVQRQLPTDLQKPAIPIQSSVFFAPTAHLEAGQEQIVKLAKEIVGDATDVGTILKWVNEFVISRLEYGNPIKGLYSALTALKQVKVDCGGFDALFVALCIASGIPARIVSGFWAGYDKNDMHAWVEVQLPTGEWMPADPSTEQLVRQGRARKFGKLGAIGSDRIAFSVGCDIPIPIGKKTESVDILQHAFIKASNGADSFVAETRVETIKP